MRIARLSGDRSESASIRTRSRARCCNPSKQRAKRMSSSGEAYIAIMPTHAAAGAPGDNSTLRPDELVRYGRHLSLPDVGLAGQEGLKSAKGAIVGLGGPGSPVAMDLAAAGVGTIGLLDGDRVDLSNL